MPMLRRALFVVTSSLLHQVWHTDVLGYSRGIFSCTTPYSPIGSGECGTWNRRFAGKYALSGREHIDCVGLASHVSSRRVRNGHTLHAGSHSRLRLFSRNRGYVIPSRLPQIPGSRNDVTVLLGQIYRAPRYRKSIRGQLLETFLDGRGVLDKVSGLRRRVAELYPSAAMNV